MPDGGQVWAQAFCAVLQPRERLSVSRWADRYRVLAGKAASEPGQWRTDRAPYMREPMDALSADSDVEEVVIWAGTQLGKSEACLNRPDHAGAAHARHRQAIQQAARCRTDQHHARAE
jgi:phage terminase large subunit GpA-like protein